MPALAGPDYFHSHSIAYVVVQFTVGTDGEVSDIELLRGVREDLDAETIRVVSSSPGWEPGRQNGKPVPVTIIFPVIYQLK